MQVCWKLVKRRLDLLSADVRGMNLKNNAESEEKAKKKR